MALDRKVSGNNASRRSKMAKQTKTPASTKDTGRVKIGGAAIKY